MEVTSTLLYLSGVRIHATHEPQTRDSAQAQHARVLYSYICAFLALKRYLSLVPASPMMSVHDVDEKATCVLLWGCNPHLP